MSSPCTKEKQKVKEKGKEKQQKYVEGKHY